MLLRNQLYAGIVQYGVRGKPGDFEALLHEDTFYRVQRCWQAARRVRARG